MARANIYLKYENIAFYSSLTMIIVGVLVFISAVITKTYGASYGRHFSAEEQEKFRKEKENSSKYSKENQNYFYKNFKNGLITCGPNLNAKLAWFLQESCGIVGVFLVFGYQYATSTTKLDQTALISVSPFLIHYIHRSWIYPCFIKTKNPVTFGICFLAGVFLLLEWDYSGLWGFGEIWWI